MRSIIGSLCGWTGAPARCAALGGRSRPGTGRRSAPRAPSPARMELPAAGVSSALTRPSRRVSSASLCGREARLAARRPQVARGAFGDRAGLSLAGAEVARGEAQHGPDQVAQGLGLGPITEPVADAHRPRRHVDHQAGRRAQAIALGQEAQAQQGPDVVVIGNPARARAARPARRSSTGLRPGRRRRSPGAAASAARAPGARLRSATSYPALAPCLKF